MSVLAEPIPDPSFPGLDPLGRQILDLERSWATRPGPRARAIRERLGLSPVRYHQVLLRTIELPEALAYDPMLVRRLRRLRDALRRVRRARRLGLPDDHG